MAATANALIAAALGQGYGGLSARECMTCLLYVYSSGATANALIAAAAAQGYQTMSDHDIDEALLYALQ